jgi:hypothetical protein
MAEESRELALPDDDEGGVGRTIRRIALGLAIILAVALLLYYAIGAAAVHVIDDNPAFAVQAPAAEASRAVAIAAALIEREVDAHRWTASDPFFLPGAALDNMPSFQIGILGGVTRFAIELRDHIGRLRGRVDPGLDRAVGLLRYPSDAWIADLRNYFAASTSSDTQYRAARKALLDYNERLARKQPSAAFERRADVLLGTLDRLGADLDVQSAALERHVAEWSGNLFDLEADNLFYGAKGRLYAYALLLRELGMDFERVLGDRDATKAWEQMVAALRDAAALQPWIVLNGAPDSNLLPSHLAAQDSYLLRARARLRDVTDILRK